MQRQPNPNYPGMEPEPPKQRRKHTGRAGRVFRGYLMIAGAVATLFGLILLLVSFFVEIDKWML
ncbi:MAG: hypothetical protein VB087_00100 [Candidatus Limiplasma sp.]|nr:hypothetical protein [Candidatus Limiplasma sp.]